MFWMLICVSIRWYHLFSQGWIIIPVRYNIRATKFDGSDIRNRSSLSWDGRKAALFVYFEFVKAPCHSLTTTTYPLIFQRYILELRFMLWNRCFWMFLTSFLNVSDQTLDQEDSTVATTNSTLYVVNHHATLLPPFTSSRRPSTGYSSHQHVGSHLLQPQCCVALSHLNRWSNPRPWA